MCRQPFNLKTQKGNFNVGCGKCYPCKSKRKQQWSFRLHQELNHANSAHFITLTYNDESIPITRGVPHLYKKDLQDFIKRVRNNHLKYYKQELDLRNTKTAQNLAPQIRYFACGEYGEKTKRPHYHVILFNYSNNIVESLVDVWKLGHVHIGDVNKATIAYTSKYIMKDSDDVLKEYPMFNTMSKRPPIGHSYFDMKKYHLENQLITCKDQNGNLMLLPRIYRKKFFTELLEKKLLKNHFIEYEKNLIKEQARLEKLGNNIGMLELSRIGDELRKLKTIKEKETL